MVQQTRILKLLMVVGQVKIRQLQWQLKALESYEFLYTLVALQRSLMYFREPAVKLQGEHQDLAAGITQVEKCTKELKRLRRDVCEFSSRIYAHACTIARKCDIAISTPRISKYQHAASC